MKSVFFSQSSAKLNVRLSACPLVFIPLSKTYPNATSC